MTDKYPSMVRLMGLVGASICVLTVAGCFGSSGSVTRDYINASGDTLTANIRRTTNGVPHIKADTLEELAFGQGYAQAEDNLCLIAENVVQASSERARHFGAGPGDINVITDFSYKAVDIYARAEENYDTLDELSRAMLRGFASGYNRFLTETGVDQLDDNRCAGQPWVRELSPVDVYAYHRMAAMFASAEQFSTGMTFMAAPPGEDPMPSPVMAEVSENLEQMLARLGQSVQQHLPEDFRIDPEDMGSNGWGLGSEMTHHGRGAVLANPHFPYSGSRRFWQSHATVPGVLDVTGASLIGFPLPQIGFNEHLAWTHTVSTANRFTLYLLELKDDDPMIYIKDGEERPITTRTFQIEVADGVGGTETLEKTFYYSEFGPMLDLSAIEPLLPAWGDSVDLGDGEGERPLAFTYRDANDATDDQFFRQWLGMGRARSLEEFQAVFADCGTGFWVNTIYADAQGNAMYMDSSSVPRLSDDAEAVFRSKLEGEHPSAVMNLLTQLAFDMQVPVLEGWTSRDDWVEGECGYGIEPFERAPVLVRNDFVQNSNDSYWLTNPAEPMTDYPILYGRTEVPQNPRTRLGLLKLLNPLDPGASDVAPAGQDGLFTAQGLMETLYSNRVFFAEGAGVLDALLARCDAIDEDPVNLPGGGSRSVSTGCAAIAGWDGLVNLDSTGAHTFRVFMGQYRNELPGHLSVAFDPEDPVNTPRDPAAPSGDLADDPMLQALAVALQRLDQINLAYDAELGSVQVFQPYLGVPPGGTAMPAGSPVPWHGGSGSLEGGFNNVSVVTSPVAEDTRFPRVRPGGVLPATGGLSSVEGEGYMIGHGTSWHFGVEFTDQGPEAWGLLSYSQSSNSASPRFGDQTQRYSDKNYRRLWFTEQEINANLVEEYTVTSQ